MSNASTVLPPSEHRKVFLEDVVPGSRLNIATPQDAPKAIVLGGQPGAGKGGLADRAIKELNGNVVPIDPDELRKYHPRINEFQSATPYNWSGLTQPDASAWADELREAAVTGRKNFIFDTTLSNGEWTADLIRDLQAKGYDVEVRAVAAHKLESELGVDYRFSSKLDKDGHGRYVPADARDAIYDKVPRSLDTIHAHTDVPIRIFNREGVELYNSRTDFKLPGAALEEAREARLHDPKVTYSLRQGWQAQQTWHRDLPEAIAHNPHVAAPTAQHLLNERGERKVVEDLVHNTQRAIHFDYTSRVRPIIVKGAGALGTVETLADAAITAHAATGLYEQGNATGAQSEIVHFGSRGVGAFGGAALGASTGAALGVESGPGLLVTGGIGAIVGTVAGDKLADAIDQQRIYTQTDRAGRVWHFDPKQGWAGTIQTDEIDTRFSAVDWKTGQPHYKTHAVVATGSLADRLNYQATNTSVELVLAHPPVPKNPYALPAGVHDTPSLLPRDWTRDPDSGAWQREVVTDVIERGHKITHTETASPSRAAELDHAAQVVIAHNATQSPTAIASRYVAAHLQYDWQRFGDPPEAVMKGLAPERSMASDGNLYVRYHNGDWMHDGVLYDSRAEGNVLVELEATYQQASTAKGAQMRTQMPAAQVAPPTPSTGHYLRDLVAENYAQHSISRTQEQLNATVSAIEKSHAREGVTSPFMLILQPDAQGQYGPDSAIATVKNNGRGMWTTRSVTTAQEMQQGLQQRARPQQEQPQPERHPLQAPELSTSSPAQEARHAAADSTSMQHSLGSGRVTYLDPSHPHHPLFQQLRDKLPANVSDEKVAELTLAAREGGVRPGRVQSVQVYESHVLVQDTFPIYNGLVDLRTPAPPMAETMQKAEAYEQQEAQRVAQWQQQEQQRQSQSHGRSM
ncbi:zeta toxin family protein [Lysobacter panacisoli]|uniref:Zeta toxin domain-containing protein n=1 Tax=Lysobacter panacisoli TaxID=1255263 RepID=A0ABP9LRZ0_9GAMM|nr:zeta toxin family protein [Lysobacter panacisoli]